MIAPEEGAGWDLPRDGTHSARVEWHLRQRALESQRQASERRQERAHAELCAISPDGAAAVCAAPAAHTARPLGSSNCHISPKDLYPTPLHAWVHSPRAEKLNQKCHGE